LAHPSRLGQGSCKSTRIGLLTFITQ
jgi:hypothetical protein